MYYIKYVYTINTNTSQTNSKKLLKTSSYETKIKQYQRVIYNDKEYFKLKKNLLKKKNHQYKTLETSNKTSKQIEIDWVCSVLYKITLKSNTKFNSENNPKIFNEEEIPNAMSIVLQTNYGEKSQKLFSYLLKKAKNTIKKLLMEIMHPEFYANLNSNYKTEKGLIGLLKYIQEIMIVRGQLITLFGKITRWKVIVSNFRSY